MRTTLRGLACLMLACILGCATVVLAQDADTAVPSAAGQITDQTLRSALTQYSPNYDFISRGDQIRAYINIYQSLYGSAPSLTASDNAILAQPAVAATSPSPTVVQSSPTYVVQQQPQVVYSCPPQTTYVVPAPTYYYPSRSRFNFDIFIGGWGGGRYWGGWGGRPWGPPPPPRHHGGRGRRW